MKRRFPSILSFALLACLLAAVPAAANRGTGTPRPLGGSTLTQLKFGPRPSSSHVACALGETRDPYWINPGYLAPPNDSYYTLLRLSDCPSCGPGGLLITTAHVFLWFDAPCDVPIDVAIVPSNGNAQCPEPDRQAQPLCGTYSYTVTAPAPGGYDVQLSLPSACCITQDAFLLIRFPDFGTCSGVLSLVAADLPCNPCFTYNDNPAFGYIDMCSDPFWGIYNSGNPNMFVDTDCCVSTPAIPGTWGRIKTLYR